jgi:membrane protease YdiL (CAAX protease family)
MNDVPPAPAAVPPPLPDLPPSTPPPRDRWRWWLHLCIINLMPLLALLSALPALESTDAALGRTTRGLLVVTAWQLLLFALLFGLAWIFSRATREDLLLRWRGGVWPVPLALLYSVGLRFAVGIAVMIGSMAFLLLRGGNLDTMEKSLTNNRPQIEALVDMHALRDNPAYFWLTITLVSFVLAGLREELWRSAFLAGLRALWPRRFGSRAGQILAVGVASLFFGAAHLRMGLLAVAMTTLLGFGLGVIMVLHRSIWPAVITHGLFNATTFALLPWLAEKLPELQKSLGH